MKTTMSYDEWYNGLEPGLPYSGIYLEKIVYDDDVKTLIANICSFRDIYGMRIQPRAIDIAIQDGFDRDVLRSIEEYSEYRLRVWHILAQAYPDKRYNEQAWKGNIVLMCENTRPFKERSE